MDTIELMDKLDAMNAFARVVAAGSYAEAARRMGLTRSAVSKAVTELEQLLGVRLLDRTTRRVTPTEAGRVYYEGIAGILADVESTESAVSRLHDEPKGLLKINAPMSFGTLYLGPAIAEFMVPYADLRIELTPTWRMPSGAAAAARRRGPALGLDQSNAGCPQTCPLPPLAPDEVRAVRP